MGLLRWVETKGTNKNFLVAEIVNINLDFIDLCGGKFWGDSEFQFQIKFSIHNYQLLVFNGIHINCKDIEEAKEIAEIMYRRILDALSEKINRKFDPETSPDGELAKILNKGLASSQKIIANLNRVIWRRHCRLQKFKTKKLSAFLEERGIIGRVWYSRLRGLIGWTFSYNGSNPQLLGSNYEQALDFIQGGTLDFLKALTK